MRLLRESVGAKDGPVIGFGRCLVAIVLGAVALVGLQRGAHADEAPTRQYLIDDRLPPPSTSWKLVLGGLGTTAGFYAMAQPFSYAWSDARWSTDLRYPVAGPWMALADDRCPESEPDCSKAWLVARGVFEVLDGLGQAGGLAIAFEGLFAPTAAAGSSPAGAPRRTSPGTQPETTEPSPTAPGNLFYVPRPIVVGREGLGLGMSGVW